MATTEKNKVMVELYEILKQIAIEEVCPPP
jgi:hypothetical protein